MTRAFTFADLFCGCGGLGYGFTRSLGFQHVLSVDHWSAVEENFSYNHPDKRFLLADLHDENQRRSVVSTLKGKCDVLLGGPPCQPFSTLGKRQAGDRRSTLIDIFLDVCLATRPKIFVIENVRGITSMRHPSGITFPEVVTQRASDGSASRGYDVVQGFVHTIDYGLAQTRIRWLAIGVRRDCGGAGAAQLLLDRVHDQRTKRRRTLKQVIGDLPEIDAGEGADEILIGAGQRRKVIYNHKALAHSPRLLARLAHVPPGGGLPDVPRRLLTPHLRRMLDGAYGNGGHVKNIYGRLEWTKPAGTIVAGIDKITCGRFVHPSHDRLLTPRECARLQSFPDTFRFFGGMVTSYYLIGNAVPPAISTALANAILPALENMKRPQLRLPKKPTSRR
jgi:DNA (cytosine-5)-methyltransferase 1